ncbi:elongation factor P 5-aminopentanone reductase [Paenactinomyces guangxiensis]|uniref:SDR family oxidoreductase n=1 Tax=Paenactinomyces guangxiensis TaxID=1490290 RepID=A0A7W2A8Q0_9BACL|nr:SDR family oxidoreductase [Paenactinomyces guangxiensis]MBA4494402.1 SDR family oxidoreductase [Paenactinomyces guangxiensis]MBH8591543.1 SDR family oxidoreductase [Paenactinomyces guangxiensis]
MSSLSGQVAWITGASGGIGAAIAESLARTGANVAVGYRRSKEKAEQVMFKCRALGVKAQSIHVDVRSKPSVIKGYNEICEELGEPDLLIHAAGTSQFALFQDYKDKDFDEMMDVHVRGAFYLIKAVLPSYLRRKAGRIILISSIWGETGGAGEVLYSAAKGAQNSMAKALAKELAPSGITVNAVAPGAILTPMLHSQLTGSQQQELAEEIPAGRLGKAEEVASLVRYLCLPESSYITGQVLHVNGGWYT